MHRLAVATPGGDSPGMNACLRSVVKHATHREFDVVGIRNGGLGLLRASVEHGDYFPLYSSSLANTLNRSGTVLKSSRQTRFEEFVAEKLGKTITPGEDLSDSREFTAAIGNLAKEALERNEIDALILIGGDTTSRAARAVSEAFAGRLPVVVIPASIDNDIKGTSETIGFDSAVAMAVAQVDAIRETAASMDRVFVVEVMGAHRGYIAVDVAMATGAEVVLIPEKEYPESEVRELMARVARRAQQDRESAIVIVAEGARIPPLPGGEKSRPGQRLIEYLEQLAPDVESRLSVLGHVLRGAPPTPRTRNLAAMAGARAVIAIDEQLLTLSQSKTATVDATLIGFRLEGYLQEKRITADTRRGDEQILIQRVEEEITVLGF